MNLFGVTKAEVESGAVSVLATADGVLVANGARCTGCQRCEMNCSLINDGKVMPYISRVKVLRNYYHGNDGEKGGVFGSFDYTPDTCHQCEDPACLKACPMGAISVRESDGVRVIDQEKCVGCGACVAAARTTCPPSIPRRTSPPSAFPAVSARRTAPAAPSRSSSGKTSPPPWNDPADNRNRR